MCQECLNFVKFQLSHDLEREKGMFGRVVKGDVSRAIGNRTKNLHVTQPHTIACGL